MGRDIAFVAVAGRFFSLGMKTEDPCLKLFSGLQRCYAALVQKMFYCPWHGVASETAREVCTCTDAADVDGLHACLAVRGALHRLVAEPLVRADHVLQHPRARLVGARASLSSGCPSVVARSRGGVQAAAEGAEPAHATPNGRGGRVRHRACHQGPSRFAAAVRCVGFLARFRQGSIFLRIPFIGSVRGGGYTDPEIHSKFPCFT